MKRFEDLTREEIVTLTGKDLDLFVKKELASQGIKIINKPVEPVKPDIKKSITVYNVVQGYTVLLRFTDKEEAYKMLEYLNSTFSIVGMDYSSNEGYITKGNTNFTVEERKEYSKKDITDNKFIIDNYKEELRKYKEESREYEEFLNKFNIESNKICEKYSAIMDEEVKKNKLIHTFIEEYLPVADFNIESALKFFTIAYSVDEETLDAIKNKAEEFINSIEK